MKEHHGDPAVTGMLINTGKSVGEFVKISNPHQLPDPTPRYLEGDFW